MRQIIVVEATGLKFNQPCIIYKLHDLPLKALAKAYPAIDRSERIRGFYEDDTFATGTLFILFYFDENGNARRKHHAASGEVSDKFAMLVISGLMDAIGLPEQSNINAVADIPLMSEASFIKAVSGAESRGIEGLWRVFV